MQFVIEQQDWSSGMSNEIIWKCQRFNELSTEDLYRILQLRAEVFVVEQGCAYQDVDDFDQQALHVMGELADDIRPELLCYGRLLPPETKYKEASIGRVVTKQSARGVGAGKALMLHSIALSKEHWPNKVIALSAQQHLESFYTKLGFETQSEPYLEDGLPHIRMKLNP